MKTTVMHLAPAVTLFDVGSEQHISDLSPGRHMQALAASKEAGVLSPDDAVGLFTHAPVSLWEEDFSEVNRSRSMKAASRIGRGECSFRTKEPIVLRTRMMNIVVVVLLLSLFAGPGFAVDQGGLKDYQSAWCATEQGALFHALDDVSLVGCLTREYAVVFAFGQQWEDAMGQAISFSARMGREPGVVLILEEVGSPYLEQLNKEVEKHHLKVWTMRPADLPQEKVEVPSAPAKQEKVDGFEIYIGFFGGAARFSDSQATATTQNCDLLFGCRPPVTASKTVSFGKGGVSALRLGMWGGNEYQYLGFAIEYSNTAAEAKNSPDGANYNSFAFMPMVRIPFFKTDSMPGGRLNLYGGAGFSRDSGRISIYIPALPRSVSGDAEGNGSILLFGAALKFSHWSLFIEMRKTETNLEISSSGTFPGGNQDSGSISYETKQAIAGVTYRIRP